MIATSPPAVPASAPAAGTSISTLSGLAGYRCGHSGACCRAGWPIPVEPVPLALLRSASAAGALPLHPGWPPLEEGVLGRSAEGDCLFHADQPRGCSLERAVGASALPVSCRQFPRLLLVDGRGWHQSLSAWCVTAARLIVAGPPGFLSPGSTAADPRVHVEALDARNTWPPLLRPGVLCDHAAYNAFESRLLKACQVAEASRLDTASLLHAIVRWTTAVREWRAGGPTVLELAERPVSLAPCRSTDGAWPVNLVNDLTSLVPAEWRPAAWPHGLTDLSNDGPVVARDAVDAALVRFVAARLMGSWVAYQGEGLRSVAASLVCSYVLAVEALARSGGGPPTVGRLTSAIRAADWLQLHLLDREVWARWCSQFEAESGDARLHALITTAACRLDSVRWIG